MANKKQAPKAPTAININTITEDPPENLDDSPFFGIRLDDDQREFVNAIWSKNNLAIFCDACAGSGKTICAVGVATMLHKYGMFDQINYLVFPGKEQQQRVGYLPGSLDDKLSVYMSPLRQALQKIGENPYTAINDDTMLNQKNGTGYINAMSDIFSRGQNFVRTVLICDEAQNATVDQLRTVLTRCHDDSKVIVIGSTKQIDLGERDCSGFTYCIEHFASRPWAKKCNLTHNYRGVLSEWADRL